MVKQKVLVTGGVGYIGARLSLYLAEAGYAVTALCHSKIPSDKNWNEKMDKVLIGDLRDENFLQEVANYEYDCLIHLVSLDHHQSNGNPAHVSSINITPVWSLLDIFSKKGLKKFIYFSTAQVYGILKEEVITESRSLSSQNPYGLTHQIGELICQYYNNTSSVNCHVVRLSNSYGAPIFEENNCWWLVVNDLCRMAYYEKQIVLQSDGSPLRDFIHGWDVCAGVKSIIETDKKHTVYNLSSGITISILEIAKKIKEVFAQRYGVDLELITAEKKNSSKQIIYQLDNSLIRSIGFETQWSLNDGINDLFDYLEQQ
ncbi:NAD-dependent epimerase/dehydratase family protein [Flavobacterium sp. HJSW_4]|uniref:NAD-dependent epimerase/dehydratase family protein n=1 Tax=Flavobacterium sp. HJSW_4 TaxID=3344660 RepID=UPI0035F29E0C